MFGMKWCEIDDRVLHPDSKVLNVDMPSQGPRPILIRDCYVKAEEVVWQQAADQPMGRVILLGQPGIGMNI